MRDAVECGDTTPSEAAAGLVCSVVVPCFNEAAGVRATLSELSGLTGSGPFEIVVVDDGSDDGTPGVLRELESSDAFPTLRLIRHQENQGYGAAVKSGVRRSRAELVVIIDADGSYPCDRIPDLVEACADADMVVGARRRGSEGHQVLRAQTKSLLRRYCSWLVGRSIPDLNSGLRVFRKAAFESFVRILPDGFSLTTTLTVAMMRNGYDVVFVPVDYAERLGRSKIRPVRDTLSFLQLILRTGMYFAPLRVLVPLVGLLSLFFCVSLGYDVVVLGDLTDKTILLLLFAMNTALFALLADMINKK